MVNVLHVIEGLSLGGAARALMTCAAECAALDGGVHTVASLGPAAPKTTLNLARQYGLEVLDAPDVETLRASVGTSDIVHVHYWNAPRMAEFLRLDLPPMRLLVKFNVGGLYPPHVITRDIVDFADMVQTTGPFAHDLPVFAGLDPEVRLAKIRMSYGAADFSRLQDFRLRKHDGYNVTYLGTVDFVKLHPDYVALSSYVRVPESRFIVCGSGAAFPVLERQARKLGTLGRFDFRREKEDIAAVLAVTDVFGYPLREDNYSSGELVLQEVAYAGIPAVIFPYGGAGRLVVNDFTGYVVRSAPEYREALEYLHRFPRERARLGRNAREYATQLYGAENAVRTTREIYDRLMTLPKRARVFGAPDGDDFISRPARLADLVLDEIGAVGAWLFIESLGDAAPWFLASLVSPDPNEQLEADGRIASSSPVLAEGALFRYRDHHPDDGFLRYWCGLILQKRGEDVQAAAEFTRALQSGCDHWRLYWYLARSAVRTGDVGMAREALQRVRRLAPAFSDAREMLVGLLDEEGEDLSDQALRLRRDTYMAAGDLARAEEAGRALLDKGPKAVDAADVEAYYKVGLELHKSGQAERAEGVYGRVATADQAGAQLVAWALFKHGELYLDQGREEAARRLFLRALDFNPDHSKARICLVEAAEPLRVELGGQGNNGLIAVSMPPLDEELWAYYFTRRAPDFVRLALGIPLAEQDAMKLGVLLTGHLAPGGVAEIVLSAQHNGNSFENAAGMLAGILREAGLAATTERRLISVRRRLGEI